MKDKKQLYLSLSVVFVTIVFTTFWFVFTQGATTIGNNITTGDITASGTTTLATTTATNIAIGSGTVITKILTGTLSIDPPYIAAASTSIGSTTLTGATADMKCFVQPSSELNDDLTPKGCTTTAGWIGIMLYNTNATDGGAAIDDGARTWGYLLVK